MRLKYLIVYIISNIPLLSFASNNDMELIVTSSSVACNLEMKMEIFNNSTDTISIYAETLPWSRNIFGAALIAQEIGAGRNILQQIYGIEHNRSIVKIESKKRLQGSIYLNERFPELSGKLKEADVVIYWNYAFHSPKNGSKNINAGALIFNKCSG